MSHSLPMASTGTVLFSAQVPHEVKVTSIRRSVEDCESVGICRDSEGSVSKAEEQHSSRRRTWVIQETCKRRKIQNAQ